MHSLLACAALAWLVTYLFVSVFTLQLHYSVNMYGTAAASIFGLAQTAWPSAWLPLSNPPSSLGSIQLGYSLAAIGLAALVYLRRTGLPGVFFAGVACLLLLLVLPIPGLMRALWSMVPNRVIDATNVWPMQRFYPILGAMFPIWAAVTLSALNPSPRMRWAVLGFLAVAVGWSAAQEKFPRLHARESRHTFPDTQATLSPSNITLTRGSYVFFGFYPAYYSDGVMDPSFESRLLNAGMNEVLLENGQGLYQLKSQSPPIATLTRGTGTVAQNPSQRTENTFETDGHSRYLLAFNFTGIPTSGIQMFGAGYPALL